MTPVNWPMNWSEESGRETILWIDRRLKTLSIPSLNSKGVSWRFLHKYVLIQTDIPPRIKLVRGNPQSYGLEGVILHACLLSVVNEHVSQCKFLNYLAATFLAGVVHMYRFNA